MQVRGLISVHGQELDAPELDSPALSPAPLEDVGEVSGVLVAGDGIELATTKSTYSVKMRRWLNTCLVNM